MGISLFHYFSPAREGAHHHHVYTQQTGLMDQRFLAQRKKMVLPFGSGATGGDANDGNVKIQLRLWPVATTVWAAVRGTSDRLRGRELEDV